MIFLTLGLIVAAVLASYIYLVRERLGLSGLAFAALRTAGLGLLLLLVADISWTGSTGALPPVVLVDRSLSMGAAGGHWTAARDSAARIAGTDGTILGFGASISPLSDSVPRDGASRLAEALAAARAVGGEVYVLTDGELTDAAMVDSGLLAGVTVELFPRDTVPGAALVRASVPAVVRRGDTLDVTLGIATWGGLSATSASVEVLIDGRRILRQSVPLPPPPARVTRTVRVPTASVAPGDRIIEVRQQVDGDASPEDDARMRIASITADPPIALVADPAGWDARYLYETLVSVGGVPVQGFARIADDRWVRMSSGRPVAEERVAAAVRGAALVVRVGTQASPAGVEARGAQWWWRQDDGSVAGDWYLSSDVPSSPMTGILTRIPWDSLPPLLALATGATAADDTVLTARLGRRGAEHAVLVARQGGGRRSLETRASGIHRWGLRGGAGAEALRTLVAAGVDWLLRSNRARTDATVTASPAVTRGNPISFRWHGDDSRDSLRIRLTADDVTRDTVVYFGPEGVGFVPMPVGVYRWTAPEIGAVGTVAVEAYSDELPPGPTWSPEPVSSSMIAGGALERLRDHWWVFLLLVAVLAVEWAWRQRRGLP